jgi:hypothetical protein
MVVAEGEVVMTTDTPSKTQLMTARIALVLLIGLALVGAIWHGLSLDVQRRVWGDIFNRPGGPMTLRFVLQPVMATIAALHDGIKDAHRGRTPYLWTILTNSEKRGGRLQEGLIATSRTILIGLVMDGIYQVIVLKTFYPGEAVLVAILLAFVPYLFLRGTIARIASRTQTNTEAPLKEARK